MSDSHKGSHLAASSEHAPRNFSQGESSMILPCRHWLANKAEGRRVWGGKQTFWEPPVRIVFQNIGANLSRYDLQSNCRSGYVVALLRYGGELVLSIP